MILGKKWKFLKKNSRAGSRFLGFPRWIKLAWSKPRLAKKGSEPKPNPF